MTAYTITSFDGNFTIPKFGFDDTSTPLQLPGKDYSGWGEPYSNNFVHLLENFAEGEPTVKRTGMLWYDTNAKLIKVWDTRDSSWKSMGASADRLSTARSIALSGAATGSVSFDGSSDVTLAVTLAPSGVAAGNYLSANISVDQYGRITSATSGLTGNDISTPVTSFNTRIGDVTLTSADVTNALGYTPTNGGLTTLTAANIATALSYTPANDALVIKKDGSVAFTGAQSMGGNRITNLGVPSSTSDAARLADVQAAAGGKTQRIYNGTSETTYTVTVSTSAPSGGSDGDVWYRY